MNIRTLLPAIVMALGLGAPAQAEPPVLTVYTYDSFASEWGPGPIIEKGFEETCECDLQFVGLDSSIGAFNRIRLEGASSKADVLLGLDINLAGDARDSGLFDRHDADLSGLVLPDDWDEALFVPFDWGHFAFVYDSRRTANPPTSFEELLAAPRRSVRLRLHRWLHRCPRGRRRRRRRSRRQTLGRSRATAPAPPSK